MDNINVFLGAGGGSIITLIAYLIWRICSATPAAAVAPAPPVVHPADTAIEVRSARMDNLQDQISELQHRSSTHEPAVLTFRDPMRRASSMTETDNTPVGSAMTARH